MDFGGVAFSVDSVIDVTECVCDGTCVCDVMLYGTYSTVYCISSVIESHSPAAI